ncbi:MAG: hypothetical protein ACTSQJ_14560 [Promethearchaeota archaeon]
MKKIHYRGTRNANFVAILLMGVLILNFIYYPLSDVGVLNGERSESNREEGVLLISQKNLWESNGTKICTEIYDQTSPKIASDDSGGAIIVWTDDRDSNYDIYAQRINSSGGIQWNINGTCISNATNNQNNPEITRDGLGGAIIIWQDYRSGSDYDIYAQRINSNGVVQWAENGIVICNATRFQINIKIISDGLGGAIITWQDYRSNSNYDIYAQRVDSNGVVQWTKNGAIICNATGNQFSPKIVSDGLGGAIITWQDYRSGSNFDIYAQRINSSGAIQWTPNGVIICTAQNAQNNPEITSDGLGGAIITWQDSRSGSNSDIYAQRINSNGVVQWTLNGNVVCNAAENQDSSKIISDNSGGAIITWEDNRSGSNYDIYAQRINSNGVAQWTPNGVMICTALNAQDSPKIVSDGLGGAIITWQDYRSGSNYDIYAQRINSNGLINWTSNGYAVCTAQFHQQLVAIIGVDPYRVIITWQDYRSGTNCDIYAQQISYSASKTTPSGDDDDDDDDNVDSTDFIISGFYPLIFCLTIAITSLVLIYKIRKNLKRKVNTF